MTNLVLTVASVVLFIPFGLRGQNLEALGRSLPRLPATAATDAVKTFRFPKGYRMELVAAEPQLSSPVDLAFDEDGRLWVVEMIDYPYDEREGVPPQGRVSVLEDEDGDGRFERRSVFADGLRWPTGLCLWDGGVFVASAPDIIYFKDTNGDHKADHQEIVFTGFRRHNVQALLSNLRWGIDNWFTGSFGQDGGQVRSLRKPEQPELSADGKHFRFRPTGEIEALSGDGRFSNTSDDFGRRFCSGTTSPVRHAVLEDRYLARNPHLPVRTAVHGLAVEGSSGPVFPVSSPEPWRVVGTAYFMSERAESVIGSIERGGAVTGFFTGATGPLLYRGTALGKDCYGQFFVGECGMNLVHRRSLTPVGCTFRADRAETNSEFLASTDNWFRPVSLANGPDGALYICDMYRETIEHPWSIPASIKPHLDLTSGRERGRIWRVTTEGAAPFRKPLLANASTSELVEALERPDSWWRETASRLIFQRQDKSVLAQLEKLVSSAERPATRAAALWAIEGLGALRPDIVGAALKDVSSGVREQAVRLAPIEALFDFDDPDARVRLELAYRMGETDDPRAIDVLVRLAKGADAWLQTAIVSSARNRSAELLRRLAPSRADGFASDEIASMIAVTIGARNDQAEISAAIPQARTSTPILLGLADGLSRAGRSLASIAALAHVLDEAEQDALDESKPEARRTEAVRVLAYGTFAAARRSLPRLLETRASANVCLAAVRSLVAFREKEAGALLLTAWPTLDAEARREGLAWFRLADRQALLLEALEQGSVSPAEIGAELRRALLGNSALADRAGKLVGSAGAGDRRAVVQAYRPALERKGNPAVGQEVFRILCASCHRIGNDGHELGPNLASVRSKSSEEILEQILDPNRLVDPQFFNYTIFTTGGQVASGILDSANETSVTLRRVLGATETVLRTNISRIVCSGSSLMPEGLEAGIDLDQMAGLIAFLKTGAAINRGQPIASNQTPQDQGAANEGSLEFRAGTAKVKITPEEPGYLLAYDRHQKAEGIDSELWTRALALEQGRSKVVLVSADILGFPPSLARSIRREARHQFGLEDGQLLLVASHTHNGPVLPESPSLEIYHNFDEAEARLVHAYAEVFRERVLEAIRRALGALRPARLSWGRGEAAFATNRRTSLNPNGPIDPDVPVLSIVAPDGQPIAVAFTYACHCTTVMASHFFKYSSDYAGAAAEEIERRRPGATALFVTGCGGDINPNAMGKIEFVPVHGKALAEAVERVLDRPQELRPLRGLLSVSFREIELPLDKTPSRGLLEKLLDHKTPEHRRHAREMLKQVDQGELPSAVPYPILVWRFGQELTLAALSGEVCVDYALRLKRELGPERTWVAGYANAVPCYIPSDRVLAEGGYEAGWGQEFGRTLAAGSILRYGWPVPFAPGLEDRIVSAVRALVASPVK